MCRNESNHRCTCIGYHICYICFTSNENSHSIFWKAYMANLCDLNFYNLLVFNRKYMFEIFENSSWTWKDKIRKNEKTRQWWIKKRKKEKEKRWWWWRKKLLKAFDASLRSVNDVCSATINDVSYVIAINDAWILTTFGPKLWSALSSYVSLKSFSLRNVAIKSFPYAVAKCIIDAIAISLTITDDVTKSNKL